jgi:hypothetical protein
MDEADFTRKALHEDDWLFCFERIVDGESRTKATEQERDQPTEPKGYFHALRSA